MAYSERMASNERFIVNESNPLSVLIDTKRNRTVTMFYDAALLNKAARRLNKLNLATGGILSPLEIEVATDKALGY